MRLKDFQLSRKGYFTNLQKLNHNYLLIDQLQSETQFHQKDHYLKYKERRNNF